jgi:hypothetical protein
VRCPADKIIPSRELWRLGNPRAIRRLSSMTPLTASVPSLLARAVLKVGQGTGPSRFQAAAQSGVLGDGPVWNPSMTLTEIARPSEGFWCGKPTGAAGSSARRA